MIQPVIYIGGPFRATNHDGTANQLAQEQNIRRAEELAWHVWRLGGVGVAPHALTRFYQGSLPDDVWLRGDLALLAKCDALLLTEDWRRSAGTRAEYEVAVDHGIPVLYDLLQVESFITTFAACPA